MIADIRRLIVTADLHLRPDVPPCRTDGKDFLAVQRKSLEKLAEEATAPKTLLIIAGDVFHTAVVPDWLKSMVAEVFLSANGTVKALSVVGNHDVDYNRPDYVRQTSLGVLFSSGIITRLCGPLQSACFNLRGIDCGEDWPQADKPNNRFWVAHKFVYRGRPPFPGAEQSGPNATKVPTSQPLIITGDNHQRFTHHKDGRWLINPGAMTRQRPETVARNPAAYAVELDDDGVVTDVSEIPLPDRDPGAVSREHIEEAEERDRRLEVVANSMEQLREQRDFTISFRDHVEQKLKTERLRRSTRREVAEKLNQFAEKGV